MSVLGFWLLALALALYARVVAIMGSWGGRRLIPIVGQLLVASLTIPLLLPSLFSNLLPALLGTRRPAVPSLAKRSHHGVR